MEVIENSSHLKESEQQDSASNYGCRLSRDLNVATYSIPRNKVETDIGLLVACKAQLSSEVIRWKTESLRLQKERDSARYRTKELDQRIAELSERTKELEARLSFAEDENEKLRTNYLKVDEENSKIMHRFSMNCSKYHSFPCSKYHSFHTELSHTPLSRQEVDLRKVEFPREDWKDVSQKLLEKMKHEMKELQELSNHFAQEKGNDTDISLKANDVNCDEVLQESITSLLYDTESLKAHLLEQKRKLEFLVDIFGQGCLHQAVGGNSNIEKENLSTFSDYASSSFAKSKSYISKPARLSSDDRFRVYFTKQLESFPDLDKVTKALQRVLKSNEKREFPKCTVANNNDQKLSYLNFPELQPDVICAGDKENKTAVTNFPKLQPDVVCSGDQEAKISESEEERICPICQAPFGVIISQKEFEEHVLDHLEVESASLLDQYVIL